ncbi:MAG: shikimate kinase [Thermoplasmata archaeon]|nr:MAG: shikimate kinase [Thermoplasmata archaeon]
MEASAYCHGAATIINGIALGKGGAFGVALKTEAKVELTNEPGIFEVEIRGDEGENTDLAKHCVLEVLKKFELELEYGARIITTSDIPISRGLKSSSAASNAIVLAAFAALGKEYSDMEVINMGINASLLAKVTLTGAFDDACATYFGNVVVTDNIIREILNQYPFDEDYEVIIHVPKMKIRKSEVDIQRLKRIRGTLAEAHDLAMKGDYISAIRMNGMAYGEAMGLDTEVAKKAIEAGAVTAGISGTGPATVILAEVEKREDIISAIGGREEVICTKLNKEKAGILNHLIF